MADDDNEPTDLQLESCDHESNDDCSSHNYRPADHNTQSDREDCSESSPNDIRIIKCDGERLVKY